MAVFGGHLVGVTWLGVDNGTFWSNMTAQVDVRTDIVNGVLLKSLAFGAVVTLIAVFQGFATAADQRRRGLRHHAHGGRLVDRHPGARFRADRVPDVTAPHAPARHHRSTDQPSTRIVP